MPFLVKDLETIVNSLKEKDIQEIEFESPFSSIGYITHLGTSPCVIKFHHKNGHVTMYRNEEDSVLPYRKPTSTETKPLKENK